MFHPNQKPLRTISQMLAAFSREDAIVLDPFMGSGTTLVAARNLGRRAIGIEIEEHYCEVAAQRLAQQVFDFTLQRPCERLEPLTLFSPEAEDSREEGRPL